MAEQLNLQVNVSGNATESVASLKKELRDAQAQVAILSDKFGATSEQAVEAAKRAAQLKDRIGDAKALTEAFNPDAKFKALSSSIQGVASGFTALQGAIGLFGDKNKELEQQLLKVQSALAFSQGLQGLFESIDSFKNLGTVIKTQVVGAFKALKAAIGSTGIGLLVVALAAIITNFDEIKKYLSNLIPGFAKFGESIGKIVNKITDFIGVTSEAGRQIERTISNNEKAIKRTETFLKLNADKYDEFTQRKIKSNLEYKQNLNDILKDETLTTQQRDALRKQAADKYNRDLIKADQDRIKDQKKITDDQNTEAQKAREKEANRIETLNKKAEENRTRLLNIKIQEKEDLKKVAEDKKKEEEKEAERQDKNVESIVARAKSTVAGIMQQNDYLKKQDEDNAKSKIEAEKAKQNAIALTAQAIGGLSEVVGRDTVAGKLFASAQALINTYLGATQVLSDKTLPTVAKIAGVASVLASGFVAVRNINKVKVPGQPSGGVNNPQSSGLSPFTPQSAAPTETITQLNQASINAIGNQAIKAYVVESDMTSSQKRIEAIQQKAKFG